MLIDNTAAVAAGYRSSTFAIESLQSGEGAKVYAYFDPPSSLKTSDLTLLDTLTNPLAEVTQSFTVRNDDYLVVQAYASPGGTATNPDIVVAREVLNTLPVPEPMTLSLFGVGLAGLGLIRHRAR